MRDPDEQLITPYEVIAPSNRKQKRGKRQKEREPNQADSEGFESRPEGPARDYAPELSQPSHEESSMPRFLELLIPPINDSPENVRRHRLVLSLAMMLVFVHIGIACGLFEKFGVSGFASAATVKEIKIGLLEQRIFDTRLSQCKANTSESLEFYGEKIIQLLREYHEETKIVYPLPTCQELGSGP